MSGDIVYLLRLHGNIWCMNGCHAVGHPAADEVERLRAEVERKHDYACRMDALAEERLMEITRLRAAGDALAVAYRTLGGLDVAHDAALVNWEAQQ